jgi:hypothetical protein
MNGIPASSLIPPAFNAERPEWIWEPKFLDKGEKRIIYMTSEIFWGWRYYTADREVRLSLDYPTDHEQDIGYAFKNGPGKTDKDGNPAEKKAKPKNIWLFRGWLAQDKKMVAVIIDNFFIQSKIQKDFDNPELMLLANGVSNYYLEIERNPRDSVPALQYDTSTHLRPCGSKACLEQAATPFYPERFWLGLNPLESGPEPPAAAGKPVLPATTRDNNGAEEEVGPAKEQEALDW